ncbi:Methyl-CpG-binding domain-containing protein 8 [Linum perenne]
MAAAAADPQLSGPVGALDLHLPIDMANLTQSELRALSLCSPSSIAASRTCDTPIPAIDRSIFNESAGSRRQTFSRSSPHHHHHRHRLAGVLPKAASAAAPPPTQDYFHDPANDPDRPEDLSIIHYLKQFLVAHPDFQEEEFDLFSHFNNPVQFVSVAPSPPRKRKRGRKPNKVKVMMGNKEQRPEEKKFVEKLEIVNKHGAVVDLVQLGSLEDPFREEIRRRTVGMTKEDELLGFLRDLEGEWCSRRRKRKFVDAGVLGDALPVGWKLLLGLKRKEGRAWVYCRRYVSPGGQHFLSCKEVSEYMQSVLGSHSAPQQGKDSTNDSIQLDNRVISPTNGHDNREVNDGRQSNKFEKDPLMSGMDNLAQVKIHDLFECHKCNMTFGERDLYLNHLLSYHQKATRRFRLGSSVGDGVIVKDGKYECQFCHKVFHERRRYNGHVGVHVRNYVRGVEESPAERMALKKKTDSPVEDEVPARTSKMDALIEIAQNSILEASPGVPNDESNRGVASDKDDAIYVPVSVADSEVASGFHLPDVKMQDSIKEKTPELEIQKEGVNIIEEVENVAEGSEDVRINASLSAQLSPVSEFIKGKGNLAFNHDGKGKGFTTGSSVGTYGAEFLVNNKAQVQKELDMAVGSGGIEGVTVNTDVEQAVQQLVKENVVPHEGTGAAILMSELNSDLSAESTPFAMFDKEENEFDAGVDELRVEDMELVGLETEQETLMATEGPVHEGVRAEIESMCNVSGPLDSEFGSGTVQGSEELPTMCTWCGMEFGYASSGASAQSGSAGYMCHSCRLKVSMEVD